MIKKILVSSLLAAGSGTAMADATFSKSADGIVIKSGQDTIPVNPGLNLDLPAEWLTDSDAVREFMGLKRKVTVCGQNMFLFYWQAPICVASFGTTVAACAATAGGFGAPACASGVALSALSCSLSIASTWGIIKHCVQ